ncbi:MAG: LamG domain-containing protein, partial [Flavobacteriales bacterium]|nr:LamG domain-containing protein [Flavobacteriales bacterium]
MRPCLLLVLPLFAAPNALAQITQGDVSICEGESVTLTIEEPEGASNAFSNSHSLDFGSGDFVRIPIAPELTDFSEVTIEFWYYQISRGEEFIVATEYFNTGWGFHNENPNVLQWRLEGGPYSLGGSNFPIPYNEWMHVAGVYDGSELRLYANGTLVASEAYSGTISDSRNEDIVINRHVWASGSSARLTGQLDELRISNVARYDGDFAPPSIAFEPDANTLALYHFDEASGSMVEDASGNDHNGSTSGTSWSSNLPFSSGSTTSTPAILWSTGETTSSISLSPASSQTVSVSVSESSNDFTDEVTITVEPCTPDLPDHVPTDGLVAWYPFNGNANDESGNGHDGIITGATFAEDRHGNGDASIEFNGYPVPGTDRTQVGLDNHVYVPDFDDAFDNGLSISLWALEFPTSESAFL